MSTIIITTNLLLTSGSGAITPLQKHTRTHTHAGAHTHTHSHTHSHTHTHIHMKTQTHERHTQRQHTLPCHTITNTHTQTQTLPWHHSHTPRLPDRSVPILRPPPPLLLLLLLQCLTALHSHACLHPLHWPVIMCAHRTYMYTPPSPQTNIFFYRTILYFYKNIKTIEQ